MNTCKKEMNSLKGELWACETSLTPPLFIEVPGKWAAVMYLCVRGINLPLSMILIFYFGIVPLVMEQNVIKQPNNLIFKYVSIASDYNHMLNTQCYINWFHKSI